MTPIYVKLAKITQHSLLLQALFSLLGGARLKAFPCSQNFPSSFTSRAQEFFSPINRVIPLRRALGRVSAPERVLEMLPVRIWVFLVYLYTGSSSQRSHISTEAPHLVSTQHHIISFPHSPHLSSQGLETIVEPQAGAKFPNTPYMSRFAINAQAFSTLCPVDTACLQFLYHTIQTCADMQVEPGMWGRASSHTGGSVNPSAILSPHLCSYRPPLHLTHCGKASVERSPLTASSS